jgi:hypothetical protein
MIAELEERVDYSLSGMLKQAVIDAVKPGSILEIVEQVPDMQGGRPEIPKPLIYSAVAVLESGRIAGYWYLAYQAGSAISQYIF